MNANEWQPIETAPKDGQPFMVCGMDYLWPVAAYWDDKDHKFRFCEEDEAAHDLTHWMPLPELPPMPLTDQERLVEAANEARNALAVCSPDFYKQFIFVHARLTEALKPFAKELTRGSKE